MNKEQIIQSMGKHYLPLSEDCIAALKSCSRLLSCSKETKLVKAGQYVDKTYFIAQGCARSYYLKDGKDVSEWFAFENEFITGIDAFFLKVPSPSSIETLEECMLLEIDRENIDKLSDEFREFDRLGKLVVTQTLLKLQHRMVSLQFEAAPQKYDNLLLSRPDITQRVPLTHIASYLGITLETLSRIRNPKNRI